MSGRSANPNPVADLVGRLAAPAGPWSGAGRLGWVHRTGKAGSRPAQAVLEPRPTGERDRALGVPAAVFFFLGAGAYPRGLVAYVVSLGGHAGGFLPYDTGGVWAGRATDAHTGEPVGPPRDEETWLAWRGDLADATAFAAHWIPALFDDPSGYVRGAAPQRPPAHGLRHERARLSWTVEAHVTGAVDLARVARRVVVGRADLVADLPDDLVRVARLPTEEWTEDRFEEYVAEHVYLEAP